MNKKLKILTSIFIAAIIIAIGISLYFHIGIKTILIICSTMFALFSPIFYTLSILKGESKPHRTTRFVLLIITLLSFFALLAQHNTVAIFLAGVSALQSILIFSLCIKYGMGGWAKTDIICLVIAGIGILVWKLTNNPVMGLLASILADFVGFIPALIKTYKFPETETRIFYILDVFAATFTILAITNFTYQETSYPIYILAINFVMVILILRPKMRKRLANF
ncbi:MAG: hypothetical protein NT085_04120 [candidate division SR1 bacterium]|nr:hypothetical protein [candidate division SR1 bacterium]